MDNNKELSHEQMRELWDMAQKAKDERLLKDSHENLREFLVTRFKTVFIGALAAFEEEFDNVIKTRDEAWQRVRRTILNNGNNQIRLMCQELDNNDIRRKKKTTQFPIIGDDYDQRC